MDAFGVPRRRLPPGATQPRHAFQPHKKTPTCRPASFTTSPSKKRAYFTLTSLISNCTATFGGNGVRGSAP